MTQAPEPAKPLPPSAPVVSSIGAWCTRAARACLAAAVVLGGAGCGAGAPPPRPVMRSVEEPRAVLVIQSALENAGVRPGPGTEAMLANGKPLFVDVTIADTDFGIAFLTGIELPRLEGALPPRPESDDLRVIRLGDATVLLLYQESYQYDAAESHTVTAVSAEAKLRRDVADFVHRAVKGRALR